ncbi:MAG: hypothetical protein EOO90_18970 [Pedobacter sp.]|nr:MAG: hypothetical protein EOO90_18970 [Pedobacter sp.]
MEKTITDIHYFWHGKSITKMELLTFHSAWKNQHQPVLWTYEEKIENLPEFVKLLPATTLLNKETFEYYLYSLKLPIASISDIIRYEILLRFGGIYSDTDIVILKNLNGITESEYFCSTYEYNYGELSSNCLMRLEKSSQIAKYLSKECAIRIDEIKNNTVENFDYCYLGPFLVQKCAKEIDVSILPFDYINPISWRWTNKLIAYNKIDFKFFIKLFIRKLLGKNVSGYQITKNTFAVHLSNETWKQNSLNKNENYHSLSIYEKLKKRYLKDE